MERKLNSLEICIVGSQGYSMKLNQQSESDWRVGTRDAGYTCSHLDLGVVWQRCGLTRVILRIHI